MSKASRIWHYGLVARWWAEFNLAGEDLDVFRRLIADSGEPVLDAGCGTGRLLLPCLRDAIDIDGSDASADMLRWCRQRAEGEQLPVNLYAGVMHELDLPRQYKTIIICGAFGLGGSRDDDLQGLRRLRRQLEAGGRLYMDHYLPNLEAPEVWNSWVTKPELPGPWPVRGDRRSASDGTEWEIRTRQLDFDPLEQKTTLEIRVSQFRGDEEIASETNAIDINLYFRKEIELMLAMAGFSTVTVRAFGEDRAPRPWEDRRIMFEAVA